MDFADPNGRALQYSRRAFRYEAAQQLGLHQVPVIAISGLSDAEKRALALADNKIPSKSGWDRSSLAAELSELSVLLPEMGLGISLTGFEPFELNALVTEAADPGSGESDSIPEIACGPTPASTASGLVVSTSSSCIRLESYAQRLLTQTRRKSIEQLKVALRAAEIVLSEDDRMKLEMIPAR